MSKLAATAAWILAGTVGAVVALELLLQVLPVSGKGTYGAEIDPKWPMHHLLPDSNFTYSVGWNLENVHSGRINNMGYVAPFDYVAGTPGIVVLGDSYVESLMNDYSQTLQGRLGGLLEQPSAVLQFANSGASAADYLAVAGLVAGRFKPTWGIVVMSEGDFVEGFAADRGHGYHNWDSSAQPPVKLTGFEQERSPLVKAARRIALIRYLRYNLKVDLQNLIRFEPVSDDQAGPMECAPVELSASDAALASSFAELLPGQFGLDPTHVILVFDSDRKSLYDPKRRNTPRCATRDSEAQKLIRAKAIERGIKVIEMGPVFASYYDRTHRRVDHSPADWHWNAAAHELVAHEAAGIINDASRPH